MKTTIKILIISFILLIPTSLAVTLSMHEPEPITYFDIHVEEYDTPLLYLLSAEQDFTSLEIIEHEFQKNYSDSPSMVFCTQNNIHSNNNISILYYTPIDYELLKKGKLDLLRIFIPSTYYSDSYKYTTTSMTLRVHYQNKLKPLIPPNNLQKVGTIIENPMVLSSFDSQQTSYDPQSHPKYLIITNETLWPIFYNYFKDWKIANDPKIPNMAIINVSDIISDPLWGVNGTYGDSVNDTNGNSWIPDGKEIHSNWELFNDTPAQIRNYIRYAQLLNCEYVLLGGNKDVVPPRMACSRATGNGGGAYSNDLSHASDMYYGCLHFSMNNNTNSYFMENECIAYEFDEIDWGFDIVVGRVLVNSPLQLFNWINKTKNYTLGNIGQGNYLQNHICAAKDVGNAITDDTWLDLGGEYSASIGEQTIPITNLTFVNNQNITQAQWTIMNDYCNGTVSGFDGVHMILHAGHGGTLYSSNGGMYRPSVLGNQQTPNFVYSESCHSANFGESDNSRAENWIYNDVGMFAGIVNSAYGWFGASTDYIVEMLNQMFNESTGNYTYCFAQAHNDAREIYGHNYGSPDWGLFAMIVKETNFFGDPALEYNWYDSGFTPESSDIQFISIDGGINRTTVYTSRPTFNWSLIANTSQYNLQISNNSIFTDLVLNLTNISLLNFPAHYTSNATTVSFTIPSYYELSYYNKLYYCRVRAYVEV